MKWRFGFTLFCIVVSVGVAQAQNSVGIGVANPNKNAVLELISPNHNQGVLIPKLTTAQRTAASFVNGLSVKENGLMVFDSDENKFYYWELNAWKAIGVTQLASGNGITIDNGVVSTIPQDLTLTGNTLKITQNANATPIDLSPLNVPQDLTLTGNTLTITNNPSATPINLAAFQGTNTDEQQLSYDPATGVLSITRPTAGTPQTVNVSAAGTAGGDLSGTYPNPTLGTGAITSAKILDGTIAGNDLAALAVTNAHIATGVAVDKLTGGTLNHVLTTTGGGVAWAALPGSVSSITAGTGLSGGTITSTGTLALTTTGVTAATYGSATQVPVVQIDAQGRITTAGNTTIAGVAPGGAAGGDLTGTYPVPTIAANAVTSAKINDGEVVNADIAAGAGIAVSKLANGTPTQVLTAAAGSPVWQALPASVSSITGGTGLSGGTITSTGTLALTNTGVAAATYGSATQVPVVQIDAQGRITTAGNTTIAGVAPGGAAGGDLTGTYPIPTIAANAVTSAKINDGEVVNADIAAAAGIVVSKLAGGTLTHVLTTTAGGAAWQALPASVTSITGGTGLSGGTITSAGTLALTNTGVAAATYGSATQVPVVQIDAQGRITTAGNTTIAGVAPGGAAGGDLTGTYPVPTIAANAVTSAKILDGEIVNLDIANAAAIAVTKLANGTPTNVLTATAGGPAWLPPVTGVTSITAGAGLSGGTITTTGTVALTNTGVTAASYGSATQVPVIQIDAQGRITTAGNTTIAVPPSGAAGGDLTNTYPNPTIAANAVTSAKILDGEIVNADIAGAANIDVGKFLPGGAGLVITSTGTSVGWAPPSGTLLINAVGTRNLHAGQNIGGNATATDNAFFGAFAAFSHTAGVNNSWNVAVGAQAGQNMDEGGLNTLVGWQAGFGGAGVSATFNGNTFIGSEAGRASTSGPNTFIGEKAGNLNSTGTESVFVGNRAGAVNTTGGRHTIIGYEANVSAAGLQNATAIGYQAIVNASNKIRLGNAAVTVIEGQVAYSFPSDRRLKTNIQPLTNALDVVMKLKPVSYQMKNSSDTRTNWGFIAQDVKALVGENNTVVNTSEDEEKRLTLRYTDFIAPLVKAVQEQQDQITNLNAKLGESEKKYAELAAELEQIKKAIGMKAGR